MRYDSEPDPLAGSLPGRPLLEAGRAVKEDSFRYLDAQIWATAKLDQISIVLRESVPVGQPSRGAPSKIHLPRNTT